MGAALITSLQIGLALDFELFLSLRIAEYRARGFSVTASVSKGFHKTASLINTAGLIMIIAFGTLMASSQMLLVQGGFLLSFSGFLDTYVTRTILVPALMFSLGKWNWWPTTSRDAACCGSHHRALRSWQLPPGTLGTDNVDDELIHH
jgi:RND superfamily putative drug exporter